MTKSYMQVKAQIAKLEKEAAALRASETTKVVAQIRASIATFGLSVEQLFGKGAKALQAAAGKVMGASGKASRKGAGIAKYRDPKTGKTWTGFGKAPGWIANARNRDRFLIDQPGVAGAASAEKSATPPVKKVTRKARAVATPAKKGARTKKSAAVKATASPANAQKPDGTNAAAKKRAPSKKSVVPTKAVPASKRAKESGAIATQARKVTAKAVQSKSAAKSRSRVKTSDDPVAANATLANGKSVEVANG